MEALTVTDNQWIHDIQRVLSVVAIADYLVLWDLLAEAQLQSVVPDKLIGGVFLAQANTQLSRLMMLYFKAPFTLSLGDEYGSHTYGIWLGLEEFGFHPALPSQLWARQYFGEKIGRPYLAHAQAQK